jgi:hypothetical protein
VSAVDPHDALLLLLRVSRAPSTPIQHAHERIYRRAPRVVRLQVGDPLPLLGGEHAARRARQSEFSQAGDDGALVARAAFVARELV